MRTESSQLEKAMQNRHMSVSAFVDDLVTLPTNNAALSTLSTHSAGNQFGNQFEGYLFKRTSKGFKSWNRRWFYLCDNQLLYKYVKRYMCSKHIAWEQNLTIFIFSIYFSYRKRGDNDIPTVMEEDLRICTVRPVNSDSDRRFCFEVISPTK